MDQLLILYKELNQLDLLCLTLYLNYKLWLKKDSGINEFKDLKGKKITAALSTTPETEFLKNAKANGWDASDYFSSKKKAILT